MEEASPLLVDPTAPRQSPDVEKMIATMIVFNNGVDKMLGGYEQQRFVRLHYVLEKPQSADPPGTVITHIFVAIRLDESARRELPKGMDECKIGGDFSIFGVVARATPSADVHVEFRGLGNNDRYFTAACAAFADPDRRSAFHLSRLPHTSAYGFNLPVDVFLFQRETNLGPAFEDELVRLYWPHAFSESPDYDPMTLGAVQYGPTFFFVLLEALEEKGALEFNVPTPIEHPASLKEPFPSLADGSFKDVVRNLDQQWLAFLKTVASRSGSSLNTDGTGMRRSLVRFDVSELGSKQFWDVLADGDDLPREGNCLGARFLVDKKYARPDELVNYRGCVAQKSVGPELP